jgi:hypothetical protein
MTLRNWKALQNGFVTLTAVATDRSGKSRLSGTVTDGTGAAVAERR